MEKYLEKLTRLSDKAGTLGSLTAALGCASCFPALGYLAGSIGLGFLSRYEGIFINTLLPLFAVIALASQVIAFFTHRCRYRVIAGTTGPILILLTLYPLWSYHWSTYLLYTGLLLMLVSSAWDLFMPARKVCPKHNDYSQDGVT